MSQTTSNNKRIAKNAVALYIRMILTTLVSLYTSRIVLSTLGVDDFGVYGIVGGVVTMFAFLKSTMSGATSRFITFALGKQNEQELKDTFSSALLIHIGIAALIFICAETIGLWYVENHLVVPEGRMNAARIVYQFSILTMMITVTQVPYNACIIAHERMGVYAYVEILDVVLKLMIVYLLQVLLTDRLITYGALMFLVSCTVAMVYRIYCKRHFTECHLRKIWRKELLIPMLKFSGWDLYGNMCYTVKGQGINLLINKFFGVAFNAASSVANSIQGVVGNFSANVIQAFRPQIVKSYAANDLERMQQLMYNAIKFSLLLFLLCAIPLICEAHEVLYLWLGTVPSYADIFCQLMLTVSYFSLINKILSISIVATGEMRRISIITGTVHILALPAIYITFKTIQGTPVFAYIWAIIAMICVDISNLLIIRKQIPNLKISYFLKGILEATSIALVAAIPVIPIRTTLDEGITRLLILGLIYMISLSVLTYFFGIDKDMRNKVNNVILTKLHIKRRTA